VVFSFFRKDKPTESATTQLVKIATPIAIPSAQTTPSVTLHPPGAANPDPLAMDSELDPNPTTIMDGIEVIESISGVSSYVEEAAIYYANNLSDQAISALEQCLRNQPVQKESQPWQMLFELYEGAGMQQHFEELALEFAVKFERSPPVWAAPSQPIASNASTTYSKSDTFTLRGILTAESETQFQQLQQAAAKANAICLDLAKIQSIDTAASKTMLQTFHGFSKAGIRFQCSGVANLADLIKHCIKKSVGDPDNKHYWLLLLELYQMQNQQAEFEDVAVEYAVAFEVSPPSWIPVAGGTPRQVTPEPGPQAEISSPDEAEVFAIRGVISGGTEPRLQELVQFATTRTDVCIDISAVPRVDFASIGTFLNTLIQLNSSGKKVEIKGANEMVSALFSVMGVGQFATIHKNKAH
jgi:anti-anti-sigma regulatory factor